MKQIFSNPHCIPLCALLLIAVCATVLLAQVFSAETPEQTFDGDLYTEYKSHEVTTLEELARDFEWQQALWMPIAPPSADFWGWTQEADPTPLPFDPAKFPQDFIANLIPAYRDGVVVYPVTAWEDAESRDRVFCNAEGKEICRVPAPQGYDPRWCLPDLSLLATDEADWLTLIYDPSHLTIDYELILDDDLVKWILGQSLQSALKSQAGGGGGGMRMLGWEGGSVTNIQFVGIAWTNGACAVTLDYPDAFTNRLDLFTCEGSNSLLAFWWDLALTTNVDLATNWIAWTDTQAASAVHQIRFYAAANADVDSDSDGYSDGREKYLCHTDPADSNSRPFAVSGTLSYTGSLTGPLRMIAVTASNSWIGCMATVPSPGAYTNDKVANNTSYWFKAYRDGNGNQSKEYGEPWGLYSNAALLVTNNLTGIDIVLTDHDEDKDGLIDWWEMLYFGNLDQGAGDDPDNDGVNNVDEFTGGTNPSDGNDPPNVSGVVEYSPLQPQTGTIYVVAVASAGSWATNYSAVLTGPGAYHITSLPAGNYYLKSWRDVSNNGPPPGATEPQGIFSGNPVTITGQVTGIDLPLTEDFDTDGLPDWWEVQYWGATNAQTSTNDPDSDALVNSNEYAQYTDPKLADTDGDGLTDVWEVQYGFDPVLQVTNGLAGWWRLDEQRGVFIQDSSTNANHGILHGNSASYGAVGPSRWALRFSGTNDPDGEEDYIQVPDAGSLAIQNQITLAAWVYSAASNTQRQAIFEKVQAYYLQLQNGRPQFYLQGVYGSYLISEQPLPLNAWSHVAATYEGTNMLVYVNGQTTAVQAASAAIQSSAAALWLGYGESTGYERCLNGRLDDARLYAAALTSNQIAALYQAGLDLDGDGLGNLAECQYGSCPTNADLDQDGLTDYIEATVYGTDPAVSNGFAAISGTNDYVGIGTGTLYTLATPSKFAWPTNSSATRAVMGDGMTFRTNGGTFVIANAPTGVSYYVKSFLDLNGNGQYDPNEPGSMPLQSHGLAPTGLSGVATHVEKIRAMRVDLGYEPLPYPPTAAAVTSNIERVVSNAAAWGVNTLYPYAWSYEYGTYWYTTNANLKMTSHGQHDALRIMADKAHERGLKVIAWIQPANSFSNAWANNGSWRELKPDGSTYINLTNTPKKYLLSPFNTNYVAWFDGVINEVLDTGIDGVDISETMIDPTASINLTYDAAATNLYRQRYPNGTMGDENWRLLRAEVLTSNTFQRAGGAIRNQTNRYFHVTFSWHANDNGSLKPANMEYRDNTGFDLHGILDLPESARPDLFNVEFLWQNKAAEFQGTNTFNPGWITAATTSFVSRVRNRAFVCSHVELTEGKWETNTWAVTTNDFEVSLRNAITNSMGGDFYSFHLATNKAAGVNVSNVFFHVP